MLRFPGDVLGHVRLRLRPAARATQLEAVGTEGSLFLDDPWHGVEPLIELRRADGSLERIEVDRANPYQLELEDVSAAIRGEREPLLGRDDALGQARMIAGLMRSAAERPAGRAGVSALRVGLAGFGLAGQVFHAPLIDCVDGLEIAGIVTSNRNARRGLTSAYHARTWLRRVDELWGAIDLLVIATPNRDHVPLGSPRWTTGWRSWWTSPWLCRPTPRRT